MVITQLVVFPVPSYRTTAMLLPSGLTRAMRRSVVASVSPVVVALILLATVTLNVLALAVQPSSVVVRSTEALLEALQNQRISEVWLQGGLQLDAQAWHSTILLQRNFTVSASPPAAYMPILDMGYLSGKLQLGLGVQLTIRGIVLLSHTCAPLYGYNTMSAPGLCILGPSPEEASTADRLRPLVLVQDGGSILYKGPQLYTAGLVHACMSVHRWSALPCCSISTLHRVLVP